MPTRIVDFSQDHASHALTQILPVAIKVSSGAKQQQICSLQHAISYTSRSLANSIAQTWHDWLASASLQPDIKMDLPFDDNGLFNAASDETLMAVDDSQKKAKNLVL